MGRTITESQKMAVARYRDKSYDRLAIMLYKGDRDKYKAVADFVGLSFAQMVRDALKEYAVNHGAERFIQ